MVLCGVTRDVPEVVVAQDTCVVNVCITLICMCVCVYVYVSVRVCVHVYGIVCEGVYRPRLACRVTGTQI
jgi:hypothetical protein